MGELPLLFGDADRLRAEGELRLAITPPLTALLLFATLNTSGASRIVSVVAILAVSLLAAQGVHRLAASQKLIADAMDAGRIQSSAVANYEGWIDTTLPKLIEPSDEGTELAIPT